MDGSKFTQVQCGKAMSLPFLAAKDVFEAEDICEPLLLIHRHIYAAAAAQKQGHVK